MDDSQIRKDEKVTHLNVLGGGIDVVCGEHTLEGFPGTIDEVLCQHGLTPAHLGVEGETDFRTFSVMCDAPFELVMLLLKVFPKMERCTFHRKASSRDGGGHYPWMTVRPEWLEDKRKYRMHIEQH
jgi:hypothetical protein